MAEDESQEERMRVVEGGVEDLELYEVGQGIDVSEYEGQKAVIENVEVIEVNTPYNPATGAFEEGSKYKSRKLRVTTKPVTEIEGKDGKKVQIRASELFNLKFKDGKFGVSTSPRSDINKLLTKLKLPIGVEGIKRLPGKSVVMKVVTNKKAQQWLGFIF